MKSNRNILENAKTIVGPIIRAYLANLLDHHPILKLNMLEMLLQLKLQIVKIFQEYSE